MREPGSTLSPGARLRIVASFVATAAAGGLLTKMSATADDEPRSDLRTVSLRFVGSDKKVPLANVQVDVTHGYGDQQKKFGPFQTDDAGTVEAKLPPGFYSLHLSSRKELPYLAVDERWNKRRRGPGPDLSLYIKDSSAEKWLEGYRRESGEEPATRPGSVGRVTYTLLPACELVLRAVDADSGEGLAGAEFYTENVVGEDWAHSIESANLGAKSIPAKEGVPAKENLTDDKGYFRRLVGANAGFTYGVTRAPAGYVEVEPRHEVEIDITWGQPRAEYVFKFRKIP